MAEQKKSVKVLTWEGCLSVEHAQSIKKDILDTLSSCSQLVVSFSMLETMDLTIIQILLAAHKEAALQGKSFHLTGMIRPEIHKILKLAGFIRKDYTNARDMEPELFSYSQMNEARND